MNNRAFFFKIFCFLVATLLLSNMIIDIRLTEIPYLNIMMQFGLMILLIDFGLHAKVQKEKEPIDQKPTSHHFLASKFGLSTMLIGFLVQSFSI